MVLAAEILRVEQPDAALLAGANPQFTSFVSEDRRSDVQVEITASAGDVGKLGRRASRRKGCVGLHISFFCAGHALAGGERALI